MSVPFPQARMSGIGDMVTELFSGDATIGHTAAENFVGPREDWADEIGRRALEASAMESESPAPIVCPHPC